MQLTIDRFGRVVVPKAIRDELGLQPGDVLEVEQQEEAVVLRPVREQPLIRRKGSILVYYGARAGDIEGTLKKLRRERMEKLMGKGKWW